MWPFGIYLEVEHFSRMLSKLPMLSLNGHAAGQVIFWQEDYHFYYPFR